MPNDDASQTVTIDHLGAQGDGRVRDGAGWMSVAFALPGEIVRVRRHGDRAELLDIETRSPDRAEPLCPHFGACGGCSLQHLKAEPYRAFKRDMIVRALKARGLEADIAEAWITPPRSRRRVTFTAERRGAEIMFGFHARRSHEIVDVDACFVASARIMQQLVYLRYLATKLAPVKGALTLLVTDTPVGLDLLVSGVERSVAKIERMERAAEALKQGFARVSIEGADTLTERRPTLPAGKAEMQFAPGGFLQASAEAEMEIAKIALAHLAPCKNVVDLFAGSGTFALRLADGRKVHGVEGNASAVAALIESAKAAGLKGVTSAVRDLFRDPLRADELNAFDGVLLDPPRAGATAQVTELARSRARRIVYVSCDAGTLARDLRALVDGGYALARVFPVDQFLWSAHIEAVALLERRA